MKLGWAGAILFFGMSPLGWILSCDSCMADEYNGGVEGDRSNFVAGENKWEVVEETEDRG